MIAILSSWFIYHFFWIDCSCHLWFFFVCSSWKPWGADQSCENTAPEDLANFLGDAGPFSRPGQSGYDAEGFGGSCTSLRQIDSLHENRSWPLFQPHVLLQIVLAGYFGGPSHRITWKAWSQTNSANCVNTSGTLLDDLQQIGVSYEDAMVNWSCLKWYHCLNIWRMPCCHAISFSQAIKRQLNAGHIQQAFYLGSLAEFHLWWQSPKRVVEIYRLIQYDPVITQTFLFCIMVHLCVRFLAVCASDI